jgi:hypothetical protein
MGNSAEVHATVYTQVMDHALRSGKDRVSDELFSFFSESELGGNLNPLLRVKLSRYARNDSNLRSPA